jgi:hypothetical protein
MQSRIPRQAQCVVVCYPLPAIHHGGIVNFPKQHRILLESYDSLSNEEAYLLFDAYYDDCMEASE